MWLLGNERARRAVSLSTCIGRHRALIAVGPKSVDTQLPFPPRILLADRGAESYVPTNTLPPPVTITHNFVDGQLIASG
jgi:hypothetical protein